MSETAEAALFELLLSRERQLMDPAFRKDRMRVAESLTEDFREFGSSGRVWDKAAILDHLAAEDGFDTPAVEDFAVQRLGLEAALVTYRTVLSGQGSGPQASLRSSLWVFREGRWQLLLHQGTAIPRGLLQRLDIAANAAGENLHPNAEQNER